jgi:hypothetical protein
MPQNRMSDTITNVTINIVNGAVLWEVDFIYTVLKPAYP